MAEVADLEWTIETFVDFARAIETLVDFACVIETLVDFAWVIVTAVVAFAVEVSPFDDDEECSALDSVFAE